MADVDDTGPPYPPAPAPGSNAIGSFIIGESAVGTIPPFDVWKTVISQYANSPILTQLIENIYAYLDQTKNFDAFFDLIWNVDTAQGYGLDVWGRIVGVTRIIAVQNTRRFGFQEASPGVLSFGDAGPAIPGLSLGFEEGGGWMSFGWGSFGRQFSWTNGNYVGGSFYFGEGLTSNFRLSDNAYRQLILAKAAANITNGSIAAINGILRSLFPGRGNAYVAEGNGGQGTWFGFQEEHDALGFNQAPFYSGQALGSMKMVYVFKFALTAVERTIVQNSGVLPKPTGVAVFYSIPGN